MEKNMRYDEADARALLNSNFADKLTTENMHFDSAEDAALFFARELDFVKAKSYDKQYPELTAEKLFPVSTDADEGAETITWYSYDQAGFAELISNYATDLPRADAFGTPNTSYIKSLGDSYGYSLQDMRASRMAGKSLDAKRAEAARRQIDRKANEIAWAGDSANKLVGVLSKDNGIPVYTLTNGESGKASWADKTVDEIINDIGNMKQFMADSTQDVEVPDTLLLPPAVWVALTTRRIPGTDSSLLKYLKENFSDLEFKQAPELGAKSTRTNPYGKNVALLYRNDPEKLEIQIPMRFMQYAAQPRNLEVVVPCEERHGGVIIFYPLSLLIVPGV